MLWIGWMLNYLCFSLFYRLWDCSHLWITYMLWMISWYFYETYVVYWVINVLTNNELSLCLSFYMFFMYSELWATIYNILDACFTIHYSPLNIIFLPRDRLDRIRKLSIVVICLWFRSKGEIRREVRTCASHCELFAAPIVCT